MTSLPFVNKYTNPHIEQLVQTTEGLIPFSLLEVKHVEELGENYLAKGTEWYLNGKMVRRDCQIIGLRPIEMLSTTEGQIG